MFTSVARVAAEAAILQIVLESLTFRNKRKQEKPYLHHYILASPRIKLGEKNEKTSRLEKIALN